MDPRGQQSENPWELIPPPLEGVLLKEGRKNKKAWKKRLIKQTDMTLYYSKEKGKHCKGSIDLTAVVAAQATEEKLILDKAQYFVFEIELKDCTLRFGASDRLQLDYWLDGLRAILRKNGAVVHQSIGEIMASAGSNILPPFFPGENLINFIPSTTLVSDSGNILIVNCFLTNYKIHLMESTVNSGDPSSVHAPDSHGVRPTKHSVPITTIARIEKSEEKEFVYAEISCYDMRRIKLRWPSREARNQLLYWAHLYSPTHLNQTFAYQHQKFRDPATKLPASHPYHTTGYLRYDPKAEFQRLGIPNQNWRICEANTDYGVVPSYPSIFVIPTAITDISFKKICSFRTRKRAPVLSYHHTNGASLLRSSQPKRGVTGNNFRDETYLDILASLGPAEQRKEKKRMWVYDARSLAAAQANRAIGGGFEDYKNSKIIFCDIENIHVVRDSWKALHKLCCSCDDPLWYQKLNETNWLVHNYRILSSSEKIAAKLEEGQVVLVHCSDGWDRTAQLTSMVALLLDPYYRTIDGFELLIEKEWLSFGHQFELRLGSMDGLGKESSEVSPIFLQFIECVWHLTQLFPAAFEFNDDFLTQIFDHLYSCCFGTFLCNCEQQRIEHNVSRNTVSLWSYLDLNRQFYVNPFFNPTKKRILKPGFEMRHMKIWRELWFRFDEQESTSMLLNKMEQRLVIAALHKMKNPPQSQQSPLPKPPVRSVSERVLISHNVVGSQRSLANSSPRNHFLASRSPTQGSSRDLQRKTADDSNHKSGTDSDFRRTNSSDMTHAPLIVNPNAPPRPSKAPSRPSLGPPGGTR